MKKIISPLLLLTAAILWGFSFVAQKATTIVPTFTLLFSRSIVAVFFLIPAVMLFDRLSKNGRSLISLKERKVGITKRELLGGTLCGAFSCSEWVRVKGEEDNPQYLVGIVYNGGKARYICYALATETPETPPEEIKDVCAFVPRSPFEEGKGFFVIFQSASSGECIKPVKA